MKDNENKVIENKAVEETEIDLDNDGDKIVGGRMTPAEFANECGFDIVTPKGTDFNFSMDNAHVAAGALKYGTLSRR